jgi:hypothetical protein
MNWHMEALDRTEEVVHDSLMLKTRNKVNKLGQWVVK